VASNLRHPSPEIGPSAAPRPVAPRSWIRTYFGGLRHSSLRHRTTHICDIHARLGRAHDY